MAKGTRPSAPPSDTIPPPGAADDAFTERVFVATEWARRNPQTLIVGVVALVGLVIGIFWFINQRASTQAEAAIQLEQVAQVAALAGPDEAIAEIERYLARYGRTPYGVEARLILAELHLAEGRASAAITALEAVAPSFRDPLRLQATFLLAAAYEEAEQWNDAISVYRDLVRRSEMSFQRHEAGQGLARSYLAMGDTAAAATAYRDLADGFEEGDPVRGYFEMRLEELRAR